MLEAPFGFVLVPRSSPVTLTAIVEADGPRSGYGLASVARAAASADSSEAAPKVSIRH